MESVLERAAGGHEASRAGPLPRSGLHVPRPGAGSPVTQGEREGARTRQRGQQPREARKWPHTLPRSAERPGGPGPPAARPPQQRGPAGSLRGRWEPLQGGWQSQPSAPGRPSHTCKSPLQTRRAAAERRRPALCSHVMLRVVRYNGERNPMAWGRVEASGSALWEPRAPRARRGSPPHWRPHRGGRRPPAEVRDQGAGARRPRARPQSREHTRTCSLRLEAPGGLFRSDS